MYRLFFLLLIPITKQYKTISNAFALLCIKVMQKCCTVPWKIYAGFMQTLSCFIRMTPACAHWGISLKDNRGQLYSILRIDCGTMFCTVRIQGSRIRSTCELLWILSMAIRESFDLGGIAAVSNCIWHLHQVCVCVRVSLCLCRCLPMCLVKLK